MPRGQTPTPTQIIIAHRMSSEIAFSGGKAADTDRPLNRPSLLVFVLGFVVMLDCIPHVAHDGE